MIEGRTLVPGTAEGTVLLLREPLSFWGGMDPKNGRVIDPHHPQRGATLTGHVVAMPASRGSSSAPSVLAEAIRAGTAPAAILLREPDPMVALGAVVAAELYDLRCPVVTVAGAAYDALEDGRRIVVDATDGTARVRAAGG